MKKLLVPTDFSENSWNAIQYALELFKNEPCFFYLLNTYTPPIVSSRFMAKASGSDTLENTPQQTSENGLRSLLKRIRKHTNNSKHKFKTISSFSFLAEEIKETIEEKHIDLVVVGTKKQTQSEAVFTGSNTLRIIKAASRCATLVVPEFYKFSPLKAIMFTADALCFYSQTQLQPLLDIASMFNTTISIVHVQPKNAVLSELQEFQLSLLKKCLATKAPLKPVVYEQKTTTKPLDFATEETAIHLQVMINSQHNYHALTSQELGTKQQAFRTPTPLLLIPELQRKGAVA